jgi:hypothetical protein
MAIPFKAMAFLVKSKNFPPINGDTWRINLYRIERNRENRDDAEFSSWNPTNSPSFHVPDKFGKIIFSKNN